MSKKILLTLLFLVSSCAFNGMSCIPPSEYYRNEAQSYYDSFSSYKIFDKEVIKRLRSNKDFNCAYRIGDEVYAYQTFLNTKYIVVRNRKAITYIEE
jgi:hypothetical protein